MRQLAPQARFFDLFEKQAALTRQGAKQLHQLIYDFSDARAKAVSVREPASEPAARKEHARVNTRRAEKKKGRRQNQQLWPSDDSLAGQRQRCDTKEANDGRRRASSKALQHGMLSSARRLPCRRCCKEPRHEERAECGRDGPRKARDAVSHERRGNHNGARSEIAERHGGAERAGGQPLSFTDDQPLNERERGLPAAEGQHADDGEPNEQLSVRHGTPRGR